MGIWDWLSSSPTQRIACQETIWMNSAAKAAGLLKTIADHRRAGSVTLVVAHFEQSLQLVEDDLAAEQFAFERLPPLHSAAEAQERLLQANPAAIYTALASELPYEQVSSAEPGNTANLLPVSIERHWLADRDERVLQFAASLNCPNLRYVRFVALDDPLMAKFAGEWVANSLRALGMKDSESIESDLVTRRLDQAQRRNQPLRGPEKSAKSAADWYQLNIDQGR